MIQGSAEWHAARCGFITASRFGDVMKNPRSKKDKVSKDAERYLHELIAEHLTGEPQGWEGNRATAWGNRYEPDAKTAYLWETGRQIEEVGFIKHPSQYLVGGSPDGLIGNDGMAEVKCPYNPAIHIHNAVHRKLPSEYVAQTQGNLWITDRKWSDHVSFDPRIAAKCSIVIVRVDRDEEFIEKLAERVAEFRELLINRLEELTDAIF